VIAMDALKNPGTIFLGLIVVLIVFLAAGAMVIVPAGFRGAVFNCFNGVEKRTLSEGTHLLVPILESPVLYEVRTQTYTMSHAFDEGEKQGDDSVTALSADGQKVHIDVSVRYHLNAEEIDKLHDQIGPQYLAKIIRPEAQTVIRNIVSRYTVTQLYSNARQDIQEQMKQQMLTGLGKYNIILDDLLLRNIGFSDAFASAIEQKQVALQDAERMKYVLQKEELEKQRKIIAATGDAEAIKRRAAALKENPLLIQYKYVQKLAPNVKAVIADQKMLMNVGDIFKEEK
jgi:regulator of protease activity HflC (stomatin/prohibitin superfamily)